MNGTTRVIGIGNAYRGDDAAGIRVAKALRDAKVIPPARIHQCDGDGTAILGWFEGTDRVILIDAAEGDGEPGSIRRIDAVAEPMPRDLFARFSHTFGLAEAIETARSLGELPATTVVYAIVGASWEPGGAMTPAVAKAVNEAVRAITAELKDRG